MSVVAKYDPRATEGLAALRGHIAATKRPEAFCPSCGARIEIWLAPRAARWIGSHQRGLTKRLQDAQTGAVTYEHCALWRGTWYGKAGEHEEALIEAINAGSEPIQSTAEGRAKIESWIQRLCLTAEARKRAEHNGGRER